MSQAQCQELIDGLCAIPEQMEHVLKQSEQVKRHRRASSATARTGCSSAAATTIRSRWKAR